MKAFGKTVVASALLAVAMTAGAERQRTTGSEFLSFDYYPQSSTIDATGYSLYANDENPADLTILTSEMQMVVGEINPDGCDWRQRNRGFICDVSGINIQQDRCYILEFFNTSDDGERDFTASEHFCTGEQVCDDQICPSEG